MLWPSASPELAEAPMWHGSRPGQPPTPEGAWLLRNSRRRDPELIPRGDLRTGPRPGVSLDTDLWDLCGTGMLAGVDALCPEGATSDDDLTAFLDSTQAGDLRDDVESMERLHDARARLDGLLARLPERYRQVVVWRFWDGLTLAECGRRMGVIRERVRQIEARAIGRMRQWGCSDAL